jgi:glutathione S-transferase
MIRLYHFPLSPFCRKVRLVLAEKRIEADLVVEPYWEKSADFMRRNPAGRVPVLRAGGLTLCESQAICEYLDETNPDPPLMPRGAAERAEVRRLCGWFDDAFHAEAGSRLLYERVLRRVMGHGYPDSRNLKAGAAAIKHHLDYIGRLLDERRWLAGEQLSLADLTAAAHLSCVDYISDVDWGRSDALRNWYAAMKSRPSFRGLLADQVPGHPPPAHYADLDF